MSVGKKSDGFIKRQGRLHEDLALEMLGGDTVNLNDMKIPGLIGGNYPTFDLSSSSELTSVKSHISKPGTISPEDKKAYKADFAKMLGWGERAFDEGLSPIERDAKQISELPGRIPIPTELSGASPDEIVKYMQDKTVMRIPDDHVEDVRQTLKVDIEKLPGNYFLPDNPTEEQI